MVADNTKILTAEQEEQLRAPIDEFVGGIQQKIDALRADGTDKVLEYQSALEDLKRDRIYTAEESMPRHWRRPRRWRPRTRPRFPSLSARLRPI